MMTKTPLLWSLVCASLLTVGCAGSGSKPKPEPLPELVPLVRTTQVWSASIGPVPSHFRLSPQKGHLAVASENGTLAVIDPRSGKDLWRTKLPAEIRAGVGFDGHLSSVVSVNNELVAVVAGEVVWKRQLDTTVYTPPLVAGQRVFVLGADQSVSAFDGNTGSRLWTQASNSSEALVLKQAGVLLAFDDTLVAGLPGRLVGFNPNTGTPKWEVPITRWNSNRGGSDIERLIDMVGPAHRVGVNSVCVRAYQVGVGCVDPSSRSIKWSQLSSGLHGLHGDASLLISTERDGTVIAWSRDTGEKRWSQTQLQRRDMGAPVLAGRTVAVGDGQGTVHLLSREDGSALARLPTDGSALSVPLVLIDNLLLAVTRSGNVFAWRPQ